MGTRLFPCTDNTANLSGLKLKDYEDFFNFKVKFQFRDLPRPMLGDVELDYNVAWKYYEKKHVKAEHRWDEILLCSPDHIITPDMNDDDTTSRFEFIKENEQRML